VRRAVPMRNELLTQLMRSMGRERIFINGFPFADT
jgi:hypothetical protein